MDLFLQLHLHQYYLLKGELLQIVTWPLSFIKTKIEDCIMMKQANLPRKQVPFRLLLEIKSMQFVYLWKMQAHEKSYLIPSKNIWKKQLTISGKLQNLMNFQNCCWTLKMLKRIDTVLMIVLVICWRSRKL